MYILIEGDAFLFPTELFSGYIVTWRNYFLTRSLYGTWQPPDENADIFAASCTTLFPNEAHPREPRNHMNTHNTLQRPSSPSILESRTERGILEKRNYSQSCSPAVNLPPQSLEVLLVHFLSILLWFLRHFNRSALIFVGWQWSRTISASFNSHSPPVTNFGIGM